MLVGTIRCVVHTSILRSLGLHFGTLGEHFGIIWQLLGLPWGPLGAFWRRGQILRHFPTKLSSHWRTLFGTPNLKSRKQTEKELCPKSIVEKMCSQSPCEMAKSGLRMVNTICFERSYIIHLGGFWPPFGSLLESLLSIFCKKW